MSGRRPPQNAKATTSQVVAQGDAAEPIETSFAEVVGLIEQARQRHQAVNSELVSLYWRIGEYISAKLATAIWGEGVVDRLAQHLARTMPGQRGFTRRNLFRKCWSPCDHVPRRSWPLFRARDVMAGLIESLKAEQPS